MRIERFAGIHTGVLVMCLYIHERDDSHREGPIASTCMVTHSSEQMSMHMSVQMFQWLTYLP